MFNSLIIDSSQQVQRDPNSGRLTEQGRHRLLHGQARCTPEEVLQPRALGRDPMDLPVCTYEVGALVMATVAVSKLLNVAFSLPQNKQYMMCDWETVLRRALHQPPQVNFVYDRTVHPARVAVSCARFNMRYLASYRTLAAHISLLLWVLFRFSAVSLTTLLTGLVVLGYVAYENNFSSHR